MSLVAPRNSFTGIGWLSVLGTLTGLANDRNPVFLQQYSTSHAVLKLTAVFCRRVGAMLL